MKLGKKIGILTLLFAIMFFISFAFIQSDSSETNFKSETGFVECSTVSIEMFENPCLCDTKVHSKINDIETCSKINDVEITENMISEKELPMNVITEQANILNLSDQEHRLSYHLFKPHLI